MPMRAKHSKPGPERSRNRSAEGAIQMKEKDIAASFVRVVGTGGTISARYDAARGSYVSCVPVEAVAGLISKTEQVPVIHFENFATVPGFEITLDFVSRLIARLRVLVQEPDTEGIVVTQGTDTLEETSFLADLMVASDKPIVFTGAQLPQDHPQTDGPRNLLDAIRAAASPDTRGVGVLVGFNGQLHAARDVLKLHTSALEAFQSPEHGPLGSVDADKVIFYRRPVFRRHFEPVELDKRVELIRLSLGMDGRSIEQTFDAGVDGIVIEAFGRGNTTAEVGRAIAKAISQGIPVVISSRCIAGRVQPVYGATGGGGCDIANSGAIFAGNLRGAKARLLLMVALADPAAKTDLPGVFASFAP
jgi:L-asparaginase